MYFPETSTGLFIDYFIRKFKENSEFEFCKMYWNERMNDIPYENDSLLGLINQNPDNLVLYHPYAVFNIRGNLSEDNLTQIRTKLKELNDWLLGQPSNKQDTFCEKIYG